MTIPTPLSLTEMNARVSASAVLRGNTIPPGLRENGVEAVHIETEPGGRFRVSFEGLRTSWRPSMEVEGTGEVVEGSSGGTIIRVDVRPTTFSIWRVGIVITVFLGLTWYNLLIVDPPVTFAWVLPVFVLFLVIVSWIQVQTLRERVRPGMMVALRRLLLEDENN